MTSSDQSSQARKAPLPVTLEKVTPETLQKYAPRLAAMLIAHVRGRGQSINFVHPFEDAEAVELFARVRQGTGPGQVVMWVARAKTSIAAGDDNSDAAPGSKDSDHSDIMATIQLAFHISPNGRHRTEVRKLIVDPTFEGRGIARALMMELEDEARRSGSTLCLLDTEQGYNAEKLYTSLGWKLAGYIPNFASTPDGKEKRGAAYMYKEL